MNDDVNCAFITTPSITTNTNTTINDVNEHQAKALNVDDPNRKLTTFNSPKHEYLQSMINTQQQQQQHQQIQYHQKQQQQPSPIILYSIPMQHQQQQQDQMGSKSNTQQQQHQQQHEYMINTQNIRQEKITVKNYLNQQQQQQQQQQLKPVINLADLNSSVGQENGDLLSKGAKLNAQYYLDSNGQLKILNSQQQQQVLLDQPTTAAQHQQQHVQLIGSSSTTAAIC